jgi:hypothetical protein
MRGLEDGEEDEEEEDGEATGGGERENKKELGELRSHKVVLNGAKVDFPFQLVGAHVLFLRSCSRAHTWVRMGA